MANNRLAYGLCKKYGIELPDSATPKDAWEALKKNGIEYIEDEKPTVVEPKQSAFSITTGHYSSYNSLTKKEKAVWYQAIGDIQRGMWVPLFDGLSHIQVGRKVILTNPDYSNPTIDSVIAFKSRERADEWLKRRYDEQKNK